MTITREAARDLAFKEASVRVNMPIAIQDDLTIEFEEGWLFFYDNAEFLRTGNDRLQLFGNAPLIVSRSGRISMTGTDLEPEQYLSAYVALGADRYDAGEWRTYLSNLTKTDE
jgi:hypothetical protein